MRNLLKLIIVGVPTAAVAGIFFFTDAPFSLAKMTWHHRFERDLREKGEVQLGALVDFQWDKIYLLQPYSTLNTEQEVQLFPTGGSLLDPFWWENMQRYWTIAYQRPGRYPFLVRIFTGNWYLKNITNLWTTDPNARLRLVQPNTIEATYCPRGTSHCLALVDSRTIPPTRPNY
jgi:hypothetical protein